jgi:hypothetical protein
VIGYLFYLRNYKLALTQTFTEEPQDFRFVHCPEIKIIISYLKYNKYVKQNAKKKKQNIAKYMIMLSQKCKLHEES